MAVSLTNVVDEVPNGDVIEAFIGVIEFGIVDGLDSISGQVDRDALYMLVRGPCSLSFLIVCT